MSNKTAAIAAEIRNHAPFTLVGAATGIACMLIFKNVGAAVSHGLFLVFHPAHVVLSAVVTASLFRLYDKKAGFVKLLVVGYLGAIGVSTLSDCVLPFFGESLLGVAIPLHGDSHGDEEAADHAGAEPGHVESEAEHRPAGSVWSRIHLGFIEDWYVVNPAAILGIIVAWFYPRTRFPHAGHVLISTWASSFHVLMNTHRELTPTLFLGVFVVLFVAVWLPCCISDIIFPLLLVKSAPLCLHHDHAEEYAR